MMPLLVSEPGVLRAAQQLERAAEAGARAHRAVEARHRLGVVVEDVGPGVEHDCQSAGQSPLKSGISTSTAQPGMRARISRMHAAKTGAPPSLWSSRFTEVMTAWRSPMRATASATRARLLRIGRTRPAGRS